ncbi:MAG: FliG C-terminal domain-containing protein [Hydrogenovibrio sp.]
MKIGIKKVHENEWLVHIGYATIRMDRFSVELLNIALEHLIALEHGQVHSTLQSYIKLGSRIKELDESSIQKLMHEVDNQDLLKLMLVVQDEALNDIILRNVGGILAKQLKTDLANPTMPDNTSAKIAIQRIVEKMFDLESQGKIEFFNQNTQYI